MTEFAELFKLFGLLDGVLVVCVVMIWREWRKSEARVFDLLQGQITISAEMATKYSSFENAIRGLTEVMKKG